MLFHRLLEEEKAALVVEKQNLMRASQVVNKPLHCMITNPVHHTSIKPIQLILLPATLLSTT